MLPNPPTWLDCPQPSDAAGPGVNASCAFLVQPPGVDQTSPEGRAERLRTRPSPVPRPSQCPILTPFGGERMPPGVPTASRETITGLLAPRRPGKGQGDLSMATGPPKFPGGALGAWRGATHPGEALRESGPPGKDGGARGGYGAQVVRGHRALRGHSPGRLRRGHGAGCGAGPRREEGH